MKPEWKSGSKSVTSRARWKQTSWEWWNSGCGWPLSLTCALPVYIYKNQILTLINRNNLTIFEYISVAVSIIVALAIAEGLRCLRSALDSSRLYCIHATWIFIKLANPIFYWWAMWGLSEVPEYWNMSTFTFVLIMPSIMYLQLHFLVSSNPDQVEIGASISTVSEDGSLA